MQTYTINIDGRIYPAQATEKILLLDGKSLDLPANRSSVPMTMLVIGNRMLRVFIQRISGNEYEVWIKHYNFRVLIEDDQFRLLKQLQSRSLSSSGTVNVKAPMPGLVTEIRVQNGQNIEVGTSLVILEAMKMENEIRSPVRGKVHSIDVKQKMVVEKDQPLLKIDIS